MRKLRKIVTSMAVAGVAVMATPALAFSFGNEAAQVFAADESYTIEEGENISLNATLTTSDYVYYFNTSDTQASVIDVVNRDDTSGNYFLYMSLAVGPVGTHELVIKDANGNTVKTVEISVTAKPSDSISESDTGSSSESVTESEDKQEVSYESRIIEEGDSFEVSANLVTYGYSYHFEDIVSYESLSETISPTDDVGSSATLDMTIRVDTPGSHKLIIENEKGEIAKEVDILVTPVSSASDEDAEDQDTVAESGDTEDSGEDTGEAQDETDTPTDDTPQEEPELVVFLPITNGKLSGTTKSGAFTPGETLSLKAECDKGYVLRRWVVRTLDGRDITDDLNLTDDATFTIPDYPIRIAAELEYNLIHEIELLDVTETLEVGKPITFSGHVADNTDTRFFLLAEIWMNELDTKGVTNSDDINKELAKSGNEILSVVEAGEKYNYAVMFMTTEGYEFADDVKLIYKGKEYSPTTEDLGIEGNETVAFTGFLSFGEQTNKPATTTTTKTVTSTETKRETVTQYVYNTYTYTTYQYVTRVVNAGAAGTATQTVRRQTLAPATGDKNTAGIWIAMAIAAGGGIVSGILVGRKRKRNR